MRFLHGCLVALAISVAPIPAEATCGLDSCPLRYSSLPATSNISRPANVVLPQQAKLTRFSNDNGRGYYFEAILRAEYRGFGDWILGATIPIVVLRVENVLRTGFGNLVPFFEYRRRLTPLWSVGLGTQLEVPIGAHEKGIASDHFEAFPYFRVTATTRNLAASADMGLRFAIHSHHQHLENQSLTAARHSTGEKTLFVNPHEDEEFAYRIGAEAISLSDSFRPGLELTGVQVLSPFGRGEIIPVHWWYDRRPADKKFLHATAWRATDRESTTLFLAGWFGRKRSPVVRSFPCGTNITKME